MIKTSLFTILLLFTFNIYGQTITIYGNVFLESQTNHENIYVVFNRVAPSTGQYTAYTNSSGNYQLDIETGIYNISISKPDYLCYEIIDLPIYTTITLDDVTLNERSTIINVPSELQTIQSAINCANNGDTVIIDIGTYYENIDFIGKNIIVASKYLTTGDSSYISNTIIDGNQISHVVKFTNGETNSAKLIGLSITNGFANGTFGSYETDGGGIVCYNSSPTLKYLKIYNNSSQDDNGSAGGGIHCEYCDAIMDHLEVYNNNAADYHGGGGIHMSHGNPIISNSDIYSNITSGPGAGIRIDDSSNPIISNVILRDHSDGVAMEIGHSSNPVLQNVIIANNTGGAIHCETSAYLTLLNSVIYNNDEYNSSWGVFAFDNWADLKVINSIFVQNNGLVIRNRPSSPGDMDIQFCLFYENTGDNFENCGDYLETLVTNNANGDPIDAYNNLYIDPLFFGEPNFSFQLQTSSPCIDAGSNDNVNFNTDFSGNQRIYDGNGDNSDVVDIGAYEFDAPAYNLVTEKNSSYEFKLYPNPSTGIAFIETLVNGDNVSIEIYNCNGRLIERVECINNQIYQINLNNYDSGLYIIRVFSDLFSKTKRLIMY